jgi:hypothetical protein
MTHVSEILCRAAIGVCSLNHTDSRLDIILHLKPIDQIHEEHGDEYRNLVSVQ